MTERRHAVRLDVAQAHRQDAKHAKRDPGEFPEEPNRKDGFAFGLRRIRSILLRLAFSASWRFGFAASRLGDSQVVVPAMQPAVLQPSFDALARAG